MSIEIFMFVAKNLAPFTSWINGLSTVSLFADVYSQIAGIRVSSVSSRFSGTVTGSPTESTSGSNKILQFNGSGVIFVSVSNLISFIHDGVGVGSTCPWPVHVSHLMAGESCDERWAR